MLVVFVWFTSSRNRLKFCTNESNCSRVLIEYFLVFNEGINSEIFSNQALTLSNVKGPHLYHPGNSICHTMTFALRVFVTLLEACVSSSQENKTSLILDVRFASSFRKKVFKPKA